MSKLLSDRTAYNLLPSGRSLLGGGQDKNLQASKRRMNQVWKILLWNRRLK